MKKKLLLIPITLTALAPVISLVGCGDPDTPEPEYIDVKLKDVGENQYQSDVMTFEQNKYYRFYWIGSLNKLWLAHFEFHDNSTPPTDKKLNVNVIKVLVNEKIESYDETIEDDVW